MSFLPEVVYDILLTEGILLHSWCLHPSHPMEVALFEFLAALVYLSAMASFWRSNSFFVLVDGPRKDIAVSSTNVSRWIRQMVIQAYAIKGRAPPLQIAAYSTTGT